MKKRLSRKMRKMLLMAAAMALVLGLAVGGTMAWLVAKTNTVTNTFTVGNINIDLEESTSAYKMIPGNTIAKDPTVKVLANSEACWLFVKIDKSATFDNFLEYEMASGWKLVDGETNVYYRAVDATTTEVSFDVIAYNGTVDQVHVKNSVTKDMMDQLEDGAIATPTLAFTAYAVQQANLTVDKAWEQVKNNKDNWDTTDTYGDSYGANTSDYTPAN